MGKKDDQTPGKNWSTKGRREMRMQKVLGRLRNC